MAPTANLCKVFAGKLKNRSGRAFAFTLYYGKPKKISVSNQMHRWFLHEMGHG